MNTPARRASRRAWKDRNVERVRAHNRVLERVRRAVRRGEIQKGPCFVCGDPKVQGHHPLGYEPPSDLLVVWLCARHHSMIHRHARWETAA